MYNLRSFNTHHLQSSVPHIHKKFLANKDDEFENSHRSSRNGSNFQKIPSPYMPLKSRIVVFLRSLNANRFDTNFSMD